MAKQKYYVVWKGRKTGVFSTWEECSAQVLGFVDAEYKAFPNIEAAQEAFRSKYEEFKGKRVPTLSPLMLELIGKPIADSYCVDAACSGYPGPLEFQCVHTTTRKVIFHQGPYENGSNNVGEFLGLVLALQTLVERKLQTPIYSDSETAITWARNKKCKTTLVRDEQNTMLFDLIAQAEAWLGKAHFSNQILKWDTNAWGEIPADFGRK